ncbi:MAG TPA: HlyD family efflux transporter periplasmic adaptor subunit [Verrucomicrobiae bacterium]|nr:HlyD family efflux transporter periplasmic adaptor subunit [Verrucomicrobiae bacterium]
MSSVPAPGGAQAEPSKPGLSAVPPKHAPARRKRTGMWVGISIVVVLAAGAAYYYKTKADAKVAAQGSITSVSTVAVALGDVSATIRVTGTVAAQNFAALLAPRILGSRSGMNRGGDAGGGGGPGDFNLVLMKLAKPGIRVKTGEVVAEFDPQNQLQRLDDYKDSAIQLENTVRKMVANLAAVKEAHDQTVRTAKSDFEKAKLDLQTADIRSAIDAEKFKLSVEETEANYKQLVAESALVEESQRAQIRVSELNLQQSKIEVQRAEANVQKMSMKSPMDGIVVMQSIVRNGEFGQIREGDQVQAGQPFVQIVDPSSMVLNATVNQVDAQRLRLGMKASVHLDAYPDIELPGTLVGIGAMAKASTFRGRFVGEIPVRLKIEKADARIIPDLSGSAEIVLGSEKNTLLAPRAAVFADEAGSFVYVQGAEGWIKKKVELGLPSYTVVAIRSGIQKGDVIALQQPM